MSGRTARRATATSHATLRGRPNLARLRDRLVPRGYQVTLQKRHSAKRASSGRRSHSDEARRITAGAELSFPLEGRSPSVRWKPPHAATIEPPGNSCPARTLRPHLLLALRDGTNSVAPPVMPVLPGVSRGAFFGLRHLVDWHWLKSTTRRADRPARETHGRGPQVARRPIRNRATRHCRCGAYLCSDVSNA